MNGYYDIKNGSGKRLDRKFYKTAPAKDTVITIKGGSQRTVQSVDETALTIFVGPPVAQKRIAPGKGLGNKTQPNGK